MSSAASFTKNILQWYKKNARALPWRQTRDPYKIWISEIMLQQTTVAAVIPYYQRWVAHFPTVKDVAKTPVQKILKIWQGLGYYSRARNIHKSAQLILAEHKGRIPKDPQVLKRLPGFGPYTVGAVLSIAYDLRQPIVDANVRRVAMRQMAIEGLADTSQDKKILEFLDDVMPAKGNNIFNQALMELGALVCRNREPLCMLCPVRQNCRAYAQGLQEIIPIPKKRVIKDVNAVVGIIKHQNKYFIQRRPSKGLFADLWEFPGGKIEKGESPEQALRREIREEVGAAVESAEFLFKVNQFYTQFRANLQVWTCEITGPKNIPLNDGRKWVSAKDFAKYPMPSGSAKIVDKLLG